MHSNTYMAYRSLIDEIVAGLDKKLLDVKKIAEKHGDGHRIVGNEVAAFIHLLSATLNVAVADRELERDQVHELFKYACEQVRNVLQRHLPRTWKMYLAVIRDHVKNRREEVRKMIDTQALTE